MNPIHLIAAARPNFMKIAPLFHALTKEAWADPWIVHTGQHYDLNMSDVFFRDLRLPQPRIHLGVGSGTHAEQTGRVMMAYEKCLTENRPGLVVVVGDVNSTMAATLAAVKTGTRVAHLEAGLRSFDRSMPEEINRVVTDALAHILWTPSPDGDENLLREGVPKERIIRVGNIMIDSLEMLRGAIEAKEVFRDYGLDQRQYGVITLHRPANVDDPGKMKSICDSLIRLSRHIQWVFPVHPRTRKTLEQTGRLTMLQHESNLRITEPLSYIHFMNLIFNCRMAITDSGGIQEETTYLGIPCLTLRPNTERPVTVTRGTNRLCGVSDFEEKARSILSADVEPPPAIALWDGKTAGRVVGSMEREIAGRG